MGPNRADNTDILDQQMEELTEEIQEQWREAYVEGFKRAEVLERGGTEAEARARADIAVNTDALIALMMEYEEVTPEMEKLARDIMQDRLYIRQHQGYE